MWGWGQLPRSAPRYGGKRFEAMWRQAIESEADLVQVVTWNDWNEGSHIEPSDHFGFQYMELNKRLAAEYRGLSDDVPDEALRWPLQIYLARKGRAAVEGGADAGPKASDEAEAALLDRRWDDAAARLAGS